MDTQELINIALGALLSVVGWFARQLWDAVQELKSDISGLELHVSENYARKDDVNAKFDRIEQLLDKIYDKLDAKADR
jgi:cell division protein FtsB